MTSNVRTPPFGDPLQMDKALTSAAGLLMSSGVPSGVRNVTAQLGTAVSVTGPPTPTNWQSAQQRAPGNTQFDFNGQSARTRFRDHQMNSVPGSIQSAEMYVNNGQAQFAVTHGQMVFTTPRGGHAHRGGAPRGGSFSAQPGHDRGGFKNAHAANATYDGSATPLGAGATAAPSSAPARNASRGVLVKSNTFNAADSQLVPYGMPAADGADAAAFYSQTASAGRDRQFAAGRNSNGAGRPSANANWSNPAGAQWPAQGPNWVPGQSPAWTAPGWQQYPAQPHGHGHRSSNRGRGGRVAVVAVAAQSVPDTTGSSSPNGSTSTDGLSSAPGTDLPDLRPPTSTNAAVRRPASSASASPTLAAQLASTPDSGALQGAENWQSATSSPMSASGVATPTRTTNKFGLTFGAEFSAEIDNIVNPNSTGSSSGVSIAVTASAPTPTLTCSVASAEAARAQGSTEPNESRTTASTGQKQKQSDGQSRNEGVSRPVNHSSPQLQQIAGELERCFEEVNKPGKSRKRIVRFTVGNTCFRQPATQASGSNETASVSEAQCDNQCSSPTTSCTNSMLPKS